MYAECVRIRICRMYVPVCFFFSFRDKRTSEMEWNGRIYKITFFIHCHWMTVDAIENKFKLTQSDNGNGSISIKSAMWIVYIIRFKVQVLFLINFVTWFFFLFIYFFLNFFISHLQVHRFITDNTSRLMWLCLSRIVKIRTKKNFTKLIDIQIHLGKKINRFYPHLWYRMMREIFFFIFFFFFESKFIKQRWRWLH